MNDRLDIATKLREYLDQHYARGMAFDDSANLFELGVLDSLSTRQFVAYIENSFAVTLEDGHFFDDRFGSIAGLVSIISDLAR